MQLRERERKRGLNFQLLVIIFWGGEEELPFPTEGEGVSFQTFQNIFEIEQNSASSPPCTTTCFGESGEREGEGINIFFCSCPLSYVCFPPKKEEEEEGKIV